MNDPRDNKIRERFKDFPNEPLPNMPAAVMAPKPSKPKSPPSVKFGICPICGAKKVGQIRDGAQLRWREHFRITTWGRRFRCRASEQVV